MIFDFFVSRYLLIIPYLFLMVLWARPFFRGLGVLRRLLRPAVPGVRLLDPAPEQPVGVAAWARELEALGCRPLHAVEVVQPAVHDHPFTEWIYTSPDHGTAAEISPVLRANNSESISLYSIFADKALLLTTSPVGLKVTVRGRFMARWAENPRAAYEAHQAERARFAAVHGEPLPITSFESMNSLRSFFTRHYRVRFARRPIVYGIAQMALLALIPIILTGGLLLEWANTGPRETPSPQDYAITSAVLAALLYLASVFVPTVLNLVLPKNRPVDAG